MRRLFATALLCAATLAHGQNPPLPALKDDAPESPAVRVRPDKEDKVERAVIGGRTHLRVTTPGGQTYYLVESPGGWESRQSLDDGTRVPMWTIHTFD
jgi:hypothetical protein